MVSVAFIDDGISSLVPGVECFAAEETGVFPVKPYIHPSHATACYRIFCGHARSPFRPISIKTMDDQTGTGKPKALLQALKWCAKNEVGLINMSMGTRQYLDFAGIAASVKMLKDTAIVAACSNVNELTFPACLPEVIGVRHCNRAELVNAFAYIDNPYDQIDVLTNCGGTNSFAVPFITARVCDYLSQGVKPCEIRSILKADSVKDVSFVDYGFYKGIFPKWEEIKVPLLSVPSDLPPYKKTWLDNLILEFIKDGYRAVCFSDSQKTSPADFTFHLSEPGYMDILYNFTLPDLIFLQLQKIPDFVEIDMQLELHEDSNKLFTEIVEAASGG